MLYCDRGETLRGFIHPLIRILKRSELTMKDKFFLVTKCLLNVMFFLGIPTTITVPLTLKWYSKINSYYDVYYWFMVPFFIISGIFACLIIYELRKMIKSVEQENCFIYENVISLKRMGNYSFIIAVVSFGRLFLYSTPGVLVVILVFVIAGLFSKVLSNVFETAVQYKEDNDLTI